MQEQENQANLFPEFKAASAAEWAERVQKDLKGENPDSLLWHPEEGLTIKPCYHPEDIAAIPFKTAVPGQFPLVRGNHQGLNNWQNIPAIQVGEDTIAAVKKGVSALNQGADGLHFIITQPTQFDPAVLISQVDVTKYPVHFTLFAQPAVILENYYQKLHEKGIAPESLRGFIHFGPTDFAEKYSRVYFDELAKLLHLTQNSPDFYSVVINGTHFASSGGTIVQEIAFTISAAVACLDELTNRGFKPEIIVRNVQFRLAAGTNYFFEIAKLRSIRLLWANVVKAYGLDTNLAGHLRIHSQSSTWQQTTFDPHSNLLRATTEAMAAVIGGCDSLTVSPFDITIRPENDFSERLARNLSLILKEEAYLHQTLDPAAGSYYLESLTNQLADEAWQLFQDVETHGGFVQAWTSNYIKEALGKVAQQKFKRIAAGQDILVGTNKFINPKEKIDYDPEELIQSRYFDTTRGAYSLEVMRFAVELHYRKRKQKPRAIVASIGEAIQRHINASFAQEFFGCAGFQTEIQHFESVKEAETALHQVTADILIMSASDAEYQHFAQHFGPALKNHKDKPAIILAANPHHMKEELKEQGFDEFLFQGCDTVAIVARIQERLMPKA